MTGAFIVNRRAAILRVLLALAITFTLGFAAGRVSAAPKSAPAVVPAAPSGETSGNLSALSGALHDRRFDAERSVPVILGTTTGRGSSVGRAPACRPCNAGGRRFQSGSRSVVLRGIATWYRWHPGEAAAGPALRAFLGDWRGQTVTVCAAACLRVRLTDFCACSGGRIVDLDARSFARLALLSQGIVKVTVTR